MTAKNTIYESTGITNDPEALKASQEMVRTGLQAPWGGPPAKHRRPDIPRPTLGPDASFQDRVIEFVVAAFGTDATANGAERVHRFVEEALELGQALDLTREEAERLVAYVFRRPVGDPAQEVGGVMVTLGALCVVHGLDMDADGERELARIWRPETLLKIRAKQAAKPPMSVEAIAPPVGQTTIVRYWGQHDAAGDAWLEGEDFDPGGDTDMSGEPREGDVLRETITLDVRYPVGELTPIYTARSEWARRVDGDLWVTISA